ncbi:MAG: uncharacterized protein QOD07_97 [Frankiaceae bacterium]|jgi:uncharacterized protein YqjF (DUF2071 family)|nr:uncharacterized protein [Frankiaceae bacterium]
MRQRWDSLSFLHWPYDVDVVQRFLPAGLTVEPWDGHAWVGLVPFEMHVGGPAGPLMVRFPETNVRTYVVGPDGRPGIWFFCSSASGSSLSGGSLRSRSRMCVSIRSTSRSS